MNIHYLQHESFEDLASIAQWANKPENTITVTKFFEDDYKLPDINSIDLLIIMGGPMSVYDEVQYPWLLEEKKFIRRVIDARKKVLGICLGSQLIAAALGAKVYKNSEKEIGWMPVNLTKAAETNIYFKDFLPKLNVFQWHGDTFDLPEGATLLASSEACINQAFSFGDNIIALQFHMEATMKTVEELAFHCKEELTEGRFIQKEKELLADCKYIHTMNQQLFTILDKMCAQ